MFLQRLRKPSEDNFFYKSNGDINILSPKDDNNMPNCTNYCFLRMHEILNLKERNSTLLRLSGGYGRAKNWFSETHLPKGYELKEGSIAVFDGNAGHVAFVEKKLSDTKAIISHSQYDKDKSLRNYKYFENREVDLIVGQATISGVGKLKGFIYPNFTDKRVERDTSKEQFEVYEDYFNVRKSPNGESYDGCYCPIGIYNVLDKKETDYTWVKIDKDCWVALMEGNRLLPKDDIDYKALYEEAQAKLDKISEDIKKWKI